MNKFEILLAETRILRMKAVADINCIVSSQHALTQNGKRLNQVAIINHALVAFDITEENLTYHQVCLICDIKEFLSILKKRIEKKEFNPLRLNCDTKTCRCRVTEKDSRINSSVPAQRNALRVEAIIKAPIKCGCSLRPGRSGGEPEDYNICVGNNPLDSSNINIR